jgi:glycosyltransferase involved in cell wall biosynthesis
MRIALMLDDLRMGGGQKVAVITAQQLLKTGHQVEVISLSEFPGGTVESELESARIPIQLFPARRLLDPIRLFQIVRFLRAQSFDVLHTHLTYANIIGSAAGRLSGTPVLATVHSTVEDPKHRNVVREAVETFALRYLANRVLAVGLEVERAHRNQVGAAHITMIPNAVPVPAPISPEERRAARKEWLQDPDGQLILSIGRLCQPKGYEDLIQAMAFLRDRFPSAILVIAGDGDVRAELEGLIRELGLTDRVFLPGTRADIPRLLRAADLYVCSSRWEGLPLSILEAMMAGLPVIATRVGDIPGVVSEQVGALVEAGAPAQLAETMARFVADARLRRDTGTAAAAYAGAHFNLAVWTERMLALYQSIRRPIKSGGAE